MKAVTVPALGLLAIAASLHAQENLVGKYSGTFMMQTQSRGVVPTAISVEITSAAGGKLQGKATRFQTNVKGGGRCAGDYKLEGTYQGNDLEMTSESGGPAKDCTMTLQLAAQGNKLRGKMGEWDIEVSK